MNFLKNLTPKPLIKNLQKNIKNISLLIIGVSIIISFVIFFHNKEERCFVSEMRKWKEANSIETELGVIIQKDEKMAVARAKTIIKEWKYEDLTGEESRKIFITIKTLFEYCGIK